MADIIHLTDGTVRHTTSEKQELRLAVDVSAYDELDLLLTVQEDSAGSSISVRILTGMQMETEEGWVTAATFATTAAQGEDAMNVTNLLRYVRYELVTGSTNATFQINGMARRWA